MTYSVPKSQEKAKNFKMVRKNINIVIACFQIKGKNIIVFGQGTLDGTQALTIKLLFNCMQINMPQIREKSLFIPLALIETAQRIDNIRRSEYFLDAIIT